jgi:hypothetical protein
MKEQKHWVYTPHPAITAAPIVLLIALLVVMVFTA